MKILLLFLSLFFTLQASIVELNDTQAQYNLVPYLSIAVDESNQLTLEQILNKELQFTPTHRDFLYFHFNDAAFWFKLDINTSLKPSNLYYLNIPTAWLDTVTLYNVKDNQLISKQQAGDHVPQDNKNNFRDIAFKLQLNQGVNHYYIKIHSLDALQISIFLTQENMYTHNENILNLLFGILSGIIIMMFLYTIFYAFKFKDKIYIIFALYTSLFILMVLSTHGYFLLYLWPDSFTFNEWVYSLSFIGYLAFMILFAKEFLTIKNFSSFWDKTLKYLFIIHLSVLLLSPFLPYPLVMQFGVISGSSIPFLLIIPALLSLKAKQSWSKFYLIGWGLNIIFYSIWVLSFFAILPYSLLHNNANSIGILFELLIFSLALIYRIESIIKDNVQLNREVDTDPLTQVLNRHSFEQEFAKRIKTARANRENFYFVMLDIDKFKIYNDTYGHPKGDIALKSIATLLIQKLQRSCDRVYRLGGEEFGLMLCTDSSDKVITMVESLRKSIEAEKITFSNSPSGYLTVSIGLIIVTPTQSLNTQEIYQYADELLYQAKEQGRNQLIHKKI